MPNSNDGFDMWIWFFMFIFLISGIIFGLVGGGIGSLFGEKNSGAALGTGIAFFGSAGFVIYTAVSVNQIDKSEEKYYEKISDGFEDDIWDIIKTNKAKVIKAYRHTVTTDVFGDADYTRFNKEIFKFLEKNLLSHHRDCFQHYGATFKSFFDQHLAQNIGEKIKGKYNKELVSDFDFSMTPREYELFCEDKFKKNGWEASATQASSDQGVDVEAKRNGVKVVAQCKKFKKPVGNKAVQEVVAGIKHYSANYGVVIAPNGFTKSAIKLAESNNIKLIHHDEIETL
jgi:hypothetical protein